MNSVLSNQIKVKNSIILDKENFIEKYKSKVIMITGAGTVGEELLKELYVPDIHYVIIDNSELTLFNLKEKNINHNNIDFVLCSIRDRKRLKSIFKLYMPNIVIHTAAYKHLDLSENNMYEYIRTNVEGTINVFNMSKNYNVEQFLFVSTDKAVYPSSIMGKTKKIAEIYLEGYVGKIFTKIKILRFGNILNSSGSLLSLINSKLESNEDIYLRGKKTKRYFIYPEVVSKSIINLITLKSEGVFMIKMGKAVRILDLIKEVLEKQKKTNKIVLSKLYKGEKEIEDLVYESEKLEKTEFKEIYQIKKEKSSSPSEKINKLVRHNKNINLLKVEKLLNKIIFESQG